MADLSYMPFYIDDYEAHTAHLTPEEDGIYMRLLRLCWRSPDCMVPDDQAWLMRKLRIDAECWNRSAAVVIEEFFTAKNGRLFQKGQHKVFNRVSAITDARKKAGSKGGKAKALKGKENDPSKATDLPEANDQQKESKDLASKTKAKTKDKEEEGAQARETDFLISVRQAVGIGSTDIPKFWTGPMAERHVGMWLTWGLTEAEVVAEAKASRINQPEPPDGPKALDRRMSQAVKAKDAASAPAPERAKAQATPKVHMSPEKRLQDWADRINGNDYIPPSMITNTMRDALLAAGLVTPERLRERQIY